MIAVSYVQYVLGSLGWLVAGIAIRDVIAEVRREQR